MSRPIKDKVVFTNFVPPAKMPDWYAIADVFVCPSQWREPLARVHYEAMAAGLPIITTNRGGNAEVVTHGYNGLVINDYSSPAAFARALDYILSNHVQAVEMGRNGRRLAEKRFHVGRMAEELQGIYENALKHRE